MSNKPNLGPELTHDEMSQRLVETIRVMNEIPISGAHSEVWSTMKTQLIIVNNNIIRLKEAQSTKGKKK